MKKILFLIHDLGGGGAEKVLVNLVNNMDHRKFAISVMVLFGGGVNEKKLSPEVELIICHKKNIRGNSHIMKLFTPKQLYHHYIKKHYDTVISYLEGPCARIVSGCDDPEAKTIGWIHCTMKDSKVFSLGFRNYNEAVHCYNQFDQLVFVSKSVQDSFNTIFDSTSKQCVLYNTNESERIFQMSLEEVSDIARDEDTLNWCGVGKLTWNKGFDRMIRIQKKLKEEGVRSHLYILGDGEEKDNLSRQIETSSLQDCITMLGFQSNPYKYISKCDLFVCASHSEGFSTAATEALILGKPVCTVNVSGMYELLGDNNEWGIVTDNKDEALYFAIKKLLSDKTLIEKYTLLAKERGKSFNTEKTVHDVELMLTNIQNA